MVMQSAAIHGNPLPAVRILMHVSFCREKKRHPLRELLPPHRVIPVALSRFLSHTACLTSLLSRVVRQSLA